MYVLSDDILVLQEFSLVSSNSTALIQIEKSLKFVYMASFNTFFVSHSFGQIELKVKSFRDLMEAVYRNEQQLFYNLQLPGVPLVFSISEPIREWAPEPFSKFHFAFH